MNFKTLCQDVIRDTERFWAVWSDCSCKSSRSDEEGSIPTDVIYSSSMTSHMLPAVFSYLITSFELGENEKDRIGLYFRGETMGLIRSLFY